MKSLNAKKILCYTFIGMVLGTGMLACQPDQVEAVSDEMLIREMAADGLVQALYRENHEFMSRYESMLKKHDEGDAAETIEEISQDELVRFLEHQDQLRQKMRKKYPALYSMEESKQTEIMRTVRGLVLEI